MCDVYQLWSCAHANSGGVDDTYRKLQSVSEFFHGSVFKVMSACVLDDANALPQSPSRHLLYNLHLDIYH